MVFAVESEATQERGAGRGWKREGVRGMQAGVARAARRDRPAFRHAFPAGAASQVVALHALSLCGDIVLERV